MLYDNNPKSKPQAMIPRHLLELALEILRLRGSEVEDLATGVNVDTSKEGQYSILMQHENRNMYVHVYIIFMYTHICKIYTCVWITVCVCMYL